MDESFIYSLFVGKRLSSMPQKRHLVCLMFCGVMSA